MTVDLLLEDLAAQWRQRRPRKFSAGVLVALVRLVRHLGVPAAPLAGIEEFWARFPKSDTTHEGSRAQTLFVRLPDGRLVSLRPFYNEVEDLLRARHKRFDYPTCAPHATQSWGDYTRWLDALVRLDAAALDEVERRALDFVLGELPSHEHRGAEPAPPRWFTRILSDFDFAPRRGETSGAAYQGAVYAYLRADAPHLHLDVARVRTGSKRLQRVGDVDGWEGRRLVLSAEVKHFVFAEEDVAGLAGFAAEVAGRGAMGLVAAESFDGGARAELAASGLRTLSREDLARLVDFWDPLKQQAAVSAFAYYVHHVEKNGALIDRLSAFLGA